MSFVLKGTVILSCITDGFSLKKKSWKIRVPIVYFFVVLHSQNLLFWDYNNHKTGEQISAKIFLQIPESFIGESFFVQRVTVFSIILGQRIFQKVCLCINYEDCKIHHSKFSFSGLSKSLRFSCTELSNNYFVGRLFCSVKKVWSHPHHLYHVIKWWCDIWYQCIAYHDASNKFPFF